MIGSRPTWGVCDLAWLAQLGAHGLVRASFVPPQPIRELRDLTRTQTAITREQSREVQRLAPQPSSAYLALTRESVQFGSQS